MIKCIMWIRNHNCLHMKSSITQKNDDILLRTIIWQNRRCTSKDLTRRSWLFLWYNNITIIFGNKLLFSLEKWTIKLYCTHYTVYLLFILKIKTKSVNKMLYIYSNFYKYIHNFSSCLGYWDQTRMSIMYK